MHWLGLHWYTERAREYGDGDDDDDDDGDNNNNENDGNNMQQQHQEQKQHSSMRARFLFCSRVDESFAFVPFSVWYICFDHHHLYIIIV